MGKKGWWLEEKRMSWQINGTGVPFLAALLTLNDGYHFEINAAAVPN
jgi:hypothetical protein